MNSDSERNTQPQLVKHRAEWSDADIDAAFYSTDPPSTEVMELYFAIFSEAWEKKPLSEQLHLLARMSKLVEENPPPVVAGSIDQPKVKTEAKGKPA